MLEQSSDTEVLRKDDGLCRRRSASEKAGVRALVTLQRDNGLAKPYQVRQVRQLLLNYDPEAGK